MKYSRGFTLIELLVTVVIIGVLAGLAIPQYTQYVLRGNRSAAQSFMVDMASREKQYLLDARTYISGSVDAAGSLAILNMTAPKSVYTNYTVVVNAPAVSPPTFTITATPIAGSNQVNDKIGGVQVAVMTLDDVGTKCWSNSLGNISSCPNKW